MKRLLVTALFVCGATSMFADNHEAFEAAMKKAGKTMGPLKKALDTGAMADAKTGATALVEIYDVTEKFWKERKADDAIAMSATGKAAAADLLAAVNGSNGDAAKAAFGKLAGTCKGCHDAHREKLADGTYKIK